MPKRDGAVISDKYRQHVYDLCNRRLRDELTADEWDEEIQKLEGMK